MSQLLDALDQSRPTIQQREAQAEQQAQLAEQEGKGGVIEAAIRQSNVLFRTSEDVNRTMFDVMSGNWSARHFDQDFKLQDHIKELTEGIPADRWGRFSYATSMHEAQTARQQILDDMADAEKVARHPALGGAATLIGGMLDVDVAVPYAKALRMGKAAKLAARMRAGAAYGAVSAVGSETMLAGMNSNVQLEDIATAGIMGIVVGGALGALGPSLPNPRPGMNVAEVGDEFTPVYRTGEGEFADAAVAPRTPERLATTKETPPAASKMAKDLQENLDDPEWQAHADRRNDNLDDYTGTRVFLDEEGTTLTERSQALIDSLDVEGTKLTGWRGKLASILNNPVFNTLYERLWNTGSATARAVSVSLLESAQGAIVNNRSAAALQETIFNRGYKTFASDWENILTNMYRENNVPIWDLKRRAQMEKDFGREVIKAANDSRLGRDTTHYGPQVEMALQKISDFSEYMRSEARGGKAGGRIMPGFERVREKGSYVPLNWSGENMRAAVRQYGKDRVLGALTSAYRSANPDMSPRTAKAVAKALLRRAQTKGTTVDTNLNSLLQGDGRGFLKQALLDNGVSEQEIESLLTNLAIRDSEKGKVGFARKRTDIDLSATYDGISIVDLTENNLSNLMFNYSDVMSKRIALARHGIDSEAGIENIKNTIMQEIADAGKHSESDMKTLRRDLDQAFQYFLPGSQESGWNPWMRRAKQAANLSLLSQVGLTQIAETGAILAHVGVRNFVAACPGLRKIMDGMNHAQIKEDLGWMVGNIGYERGLLRSSDVADLALDGVRANGKFTAALDGALAVGQNAQGIVSGYTKVMEAQINTAALSFTNKVFRKLRDEGYVADDPFWKAYGISAKQGNQLYKLIQNGTIEFMENGHLNRMNPQAWSPELRESFGLSNLRAVRQIIQRPMAGESAPWLHDATIGIFGHLATFPILAAKKQFMRNIARTDSTFAMLALYGTATATVAAAVDHIINGKEMTTESLARRAFSVNNAIGWTTLGVDPAMAILGLGDYSPGGRYAGEFSLPIFSVANGAMKLPGAIQNAMPGGDKFTKSDKRALQSLPIIGRMYGMNRLLNTLVDEDE